MKMLSVRALLAVLACTLIATVALRADSVLRVGDGAGQEFGDVVNLPLAIESDDPIQGFVMVFQWDGRKGVGVDLTIGQALREADVVEKRVEDDYMVLSVLVDLDGLGQDVLPAGTSALGTAQVRCICEGDEQRVTMALPHISTRALQLGGQVVDNVAVVDGNSQRLGDGLLLENGTLTCNSVTNGGGDDPEVSCGTVDENGALAAATAAAGDTIPLCYFYRAPVTEVVTERIQGLQISSEYDCQLSCVEDSISIAGTVLEEVEAEFVTMHCDNDPEDGDGCELIAGVLIEAMVPVEGRTLPGTDVFRSLFCVDFTVSDDATCGSQLGMDFVDGLNGRGVVPISNLVSINNFDAPLNGVACSVEVVSSGDEGEFIRADCNGNTKINVADAAAIVSFLFLGDGPQSFDPPCLDACDSDDTGEINITDAIYLLSWVFIPGNPAPPPPGENGPGTDPTPDDLTCGAGGAICP